MKITTKTIYILNEEEAEVVRRVINYCDYELTEHCSAEEGIDAEKGKKDIDRNLLKKLKKELNSNL